MPGAEKSAAIAELTESFRTSGAAVLTEYRGLTVKQLSELRGTLRGHATFAVVKNTLTELAAREAGVTAFDGQLQGPSAIAFVTGDPVLAAKGLRDFAKANPLLVIKGGVLDGKPLKAEEITQLADLESREVLLAKLAGAMNASLAKAVYLFAAPLTQSARLIEALRAKVEATGPAAAPQDSAAAPQDSAAAPQDSADTPQDSADTPQDSADTPQDSADTPQDSAVSPQDSDVSPQDSVHTPAAPADEPEPAADLTVEPAAEPQDVATGGDQAPATGGDG